MIFEFRIHPLNRFNNQLHLNLQRSAFHQLNEDYFRLVVLIMLYLHIQL